MALTYANGRNQFTNTDWSVSVTTGGSLTAKTIYLSLQAQNRVGKNLLLKSSVLSISNGDKVVVTINSSAFLPNEGWRYYCIGLSTTNTDTDFTQIALIPLYTNGVLNSFPLTLEFTLDHQLAYEPFYTKPSLLPSTSKRGMRVLIEETEEGDSLGYIYEYVPDSAVTVDNLNVLPASVGRWLIVGNFTTYVGNVRGADGCKQDIRYLNDTSVLDIPEYGADGTVSEKVIMWLENDTPVEVAAGYRIFISVFAGNVDKTELFHNKVIIDYQGYIDVNTAEKRTTYLANPGNSFISTGIFLLDAYYPIVLLDDTLQVNEALILGFSLKLNAIEINGFIPQTTIDIVPEFTESVGTRIPTIPSTDSFISNEGNKRYIVPRLGLLATALSGSGVVKGRGFPLLGELVISGFVANTEDQPVLINGNGVCYTTNLGEIPEDAVPRAIVSTVSGESKVCDYSSNITLTTLQGLKITVNHPCTVDGYGSIRNTYPDVLANNNNGLFNPVSINVYVQKVSNSEIRKFTGFLVVADEFQEIDIDDWNSGTVVGSVPGTEFGLYNPVSNTVVTRLGSNFSAGDYRVCFSYIYDGEQITDISHTGDILGESIITTSNTDIVSLLEDAKYWEEPANTITSLKQRDITYYEDGTIVYVKTEESLFLYDKYSLDSSDDITIFSPNSGIGKWIKLTVSSSGGSSVGSVDTRDIWLFG